MGNFGGSYSEDPRTILNEMKRFQGLLCQQNIPISDVDENLTVSLWISLARRLTEALGTGASGEAWKPVGQALPNNFSLVGGGGTPDTGLSFYLKGFRVPLFSSVLYDNLGTTEDERAIHSKNNGVTDTSITDTSANYTPNELVGRLLKPNISNPATFPIVSNTRTSIVVGGGVLSVASVGDRYAVLLSTPIGSDRNDEIWLNIYQDEIDASEDPSLIRSIEGVSMECKRALRLETNIFVREGSASPFNDYVDDDGNNHYTIKIGAIHRVDGQNTINPSEVVDERKKYVNLSDVRDELNRIAVFVGSELGFPNPPSYSQANYFPQNSPIVFAVDLLDQALASVEPGMIRSVVIPQHDSYNTMEDCFADATAPSNSTVVCNNDDYMEISSVLSPVFSIENLVLKSFYGGFNQNVGLIKNISGSIATTVIRYLLIDSWIKVSGILFDTKDVSPIPYGVVVSGSDDIDVHFFGDRFRIPISFVSFTGSLWVSLYQCVFEVPVLLQRMSTRTPYTSMIVDCVFLDSFGIQSSVNPGTIVYAHKCSFSSLPTVSDVNTTLILVGCFVAGVFYSEVTIDSTGIVKGVFFEPSLTTAKRDSLGSINPGAIIYNSSLSIPQVRGTSLWMDSVSRASQKFVGYDISPSSVDSPLSLEDGVGEDLAVFDSQIVGLSIFCSPMCSAGSLVAKITIDGVVVATMSPTLNLVSPSRNYQTVPIGTTPLFVAKGHTYGVAVTTDGSWLPVDNTVVAIVHLITKGD